MKEKINQAYICKDCKKTVPWNWTICGTCEEKNGRTSMPEGWHYWPQLPGTYISPVLVICDTCFDKEEYKKQRKEVERLSKIGKCKDCGSRLA